MKREVLRIWSSKEKRPLYGKSGKGFVASGLLSLRFCLKNDSRGSRKSVRFKNWGSRRWAKEGLRATDLHALLCGESTEVDLVESTADDLVKYVATWENAGDPSRNWKTNAIGRVQHKQETTSRESYMLRELFCMQRRKALSIAIYPEITSGVLHIDLDLTAEAQMAQGKLMVICEVDVPGFGLPTNQEPTC